MADTQTAGFSFLELFISADWVVKVVMIGLILASIWCWALAIDKLRQLASLEAGFRAAEAALAEGRGLDAPEEGRGKSKADATNRVIQAGLAEIRAARRVAPLSESGIDRALARMERAMSTALSRELARVERGMGFLATIGASAPFVGLFGTVWGIMNAFRSIAASHDTNLSVVAPGIAEALFATALGLLAAIPAVIFYNWLTGNIDRHASRVEALCDDVIMKMSRRMSEGQ